MQHLLTSLCVAGLSAVLVSQAPPRSTNSLEFDNGGMLEVSYNHIDVGGGATLETLMSKNEQGAGMRRMFNERFFKSRIDGKLTVGTLTEVAGNELDPGSYAVNFRIDEDLIWYMVVLTENDEEIFSATLAVEKDDKHSSNRLVIRPLAEDNKERTGFLEVRFGTLAAKVSFKAHEDEDEDEKETEPDAKRN